VGGTNGNDHILFTSGNASGEIRVTLNGVLQGTFTPTGRLIAYAQAGDDDVTVSGGINHSAWVYGGQGNDRLKGGGGHDVLLGEDGDDLLQGGGGRDVLIGGNGADRIVGNTEDDIMIAGGITFADRDAALVAVQSEWISGRSTQDIANEF
jgi:Ca2+-binding RTX toxin-like protein